MRVLDGPVTTVWLSKDELLAGTAVEHVAAEAERAKGVADIERAEARGFSGCDAVFVDGQYDGLHERAMRDNGSLDWGRGQGVTTRSYFRDGKLERDPEWVPDPPEQAWESHGFRCEVRQNGIGYRCGYVGLPESHPWFGKDYDACTLGAACPTAAEREADPDGYHSCYSHSPDGLTEVHGGITFSQKGERDGLWWFGFDCAHSGDAPSPEVQAENRRRYGSIRTDEGHHWSLPEVAAETNRLAEQLAVAARSTGTDTPTEGERNA